MAMTDTEKVPKSKKNNPSKSSKNVLINPYENKWLHTDENVQKEILGKLKSILSNFEWKQEKKRKPKKNQTSISDSEERHEDESDKSVNKKNTEIRSQVLFGINEVTRHLERDNLQLVLVSGTAKPAIITEHLKELIASRNCPALNIKDLNSVLAPVVKLKSILAVGLKKPNASDNDCFKEIVDFVVSSLPECNKSGSEGTSQVPVVQKVDVVMETEKSQTVSLPSLVDNDKEKQSATYGLLKNVKETTSLDSHSSSTVLQKEEGFKSKTKNTSVKKEISEQETDYSRFYVYKNKKEQEGEAVTSRSHEDFIAFSSEDDKIEQINEVDIVGSVIACKRKIIDCGVETEYCQAQIQQLFGNTKKHKKKKNKK